jgi:hypothetical protein
MHLGTANVVEFLINDSLPSKHVFIRIRMSLSIQRCSQRQQSKMVCLCREQFTFYPVLVESSLSGCFIFRQLR